MQATQMTVQQAHAAATALTHYYGSFASAIACAYFLADSDNKTKLLEAFNDLFLRAHNGIEAVSAIA